MITFAYGFIFTAFLIIGTAFLRYWYRTKDRFFAMFASSFYLLAAERLILVNFDLNGTEAAAPVYLIRLLAFLTIIGAILDKNRQSRAADSLDDIRKMDSFVN